MSGPATRLPGRMTAATMSLVLAWATLLLLAPRARADSSPSPVTAQNPTTTSADALPTVQINGVVWSQVVVGNTVYAAGKFTRARPAGAKAGTSEVVRNNLLAFDITTGNLVTSFVPNLNAQAMAVTASPDGSLIYVAGDFTQANGQARNRVAAYSTKTGALVAGFKPAVNGRVRALAATATTLYLGGKFTSVGSQPRSALAAVRISDGAVLPWAPIAGVGSTAGNSNGSTATSNEVQGLAVTLGGTQIVAAGRFDSLNGVQSTGVGAVDATTGKNTQRFDVGHIITNQGVNSAVDSLTTVNANTPDEMVIGTGYDFYGPGNLEGSFTAMASGGVPQAFNDCHGDHYSAYATGGVIYEASHAHVCENIGGFPEQNPRVHRFATALSLAPSGQVGPGTLKNNNLEGQPANALLNWFPTFTSGTATGQNQAGWTVTGNGRYIVYGGEFPTVNGVGQQGLVRFVVPSAAPNKVGPNNNAGLTPTAVSLSAGTVRVSWQSTFDNDNENLTYEVVRSDRPTTPVFRTTVPSTWWNRPALGFIDKGLTSGATVNYRVRVLDPFNNQVTGSPRTVTVSNSTASGGLYADTVLADSPAHYWRLGEATSPSYDRVGFDDLTLGAGSAQASPGALNGSTDAARSFDGTSAGTAATSNRVPGPQEFSLETWFSTTTTSGGKIIGFGDAATGNSSNYDRHVYLDDAGHVTFGVYPGFTATVTSPLTYNDGGWHHVVATLGSAGMRLYLDGKLVGQRNDVTTAQDYSGYWRLGGDTRWEGSSDWLAGTIDEAAVYPSALPLARVQQHYAVGSTGQPFNDPPVAAFTGSANGLAASFDAAGSHDPNGTVSSYAWDFGDGTPTNTTTSSAASHTYAAAGKYRVTLTVTDNGGATGSVSHVLAVVDNGTATSPYADAVLGDGAEHYWRLDEASGPAYDWAGTEDLTVSGGVTRGSAGATGDGDTAATFDGSQNGLAAGSTLAQAPNGVSIEAWFRAPTTSTGGKIVGYGNERTGESSNYDRHIWMDDSGFVSFGVWTGSAAVIKSGTPLNDGAWHHVVGEIGPAGLAFYVDGALAGQDTTVTAGQDYAGYWRIGGDTTWSGPSYFTGDIDDVAIYPTELSASQVSGHHSLAGH